MTVSVCGPLIKSLGSRIYRGMLHVAMQTWSMTCCVRYADYGRFSSESFPQTHNQCANHVQIFFLKLFFIPVPSPKKLFLVPTLFVLNSCFSLPLRRHPHSTMWDMRTQSSDLCTNKPVLPKDRIWPAGGGTRHFLPTSALLLSPFSGVCECVSVSVLCGQCFPPKHRHSVPQGQRVEDEP